MKNYNIVKDAIKEGLKECLLIGRPSVLVIRIPRREGKTYAMSKITEALLDGEDNFRLLLVSDTAKQAKENTIEQGYFTFLNNPNWSKTDTGGYRNHRGSSIVIGGLGMYADRLRGKGFNFVWVDEAQEEENIEQFMTVIGSMDEDSNIIFCFSGTGGRLNNLLSVAENWVNDGVYPGKVVKLNIYDLYELDPCEERKRKIEDKERQYTVKKEMADGTISYPIPANKNPGFIREFLVEDCEGTLAGEEVFLHFDEKINVIDLYEIDRTLPIYVTMDYGLTDPYVALFSQIIGDMVYCFDMMYHDKKNRTVNSFFEHIEDAFNYNSIDYKKQDIRFYGDQHGNGELWNQFWEVHKGIFVRPVETSADGITMIDQMFSTKQILITRNCEKLIEHIKQIRYEKDKRTGRMRIRHEISHSIDTLSYLIQTGDAPLVLEEPIKEVKEEKKEERQVMMPYGFSKQFKVQKRQGWRNSRWVK